MIKYKVSCKKDMFIVDKPCPRTYNKDVNINILIEKTYYKTYIQLDRHVYKYMQRR